VVIVDTNVIIDHLRQASAEPTLLEHIVTKTELPNIAVSVITIQELFEGQSTKNARKREELVTILKALLILPYTEEVARLAGELARDLTQPIEFPDAALAATAIMFEASLATLNAKHFKSITRLKMMTLP
jgi:predicted nucleic acid-binding protein